MEKELILLLADAVDDEITLDKALDDFESIDILNISATISENYNITIPASIFRGFRTVKDILDYLNKELL